jgi:hypothetical protein
MDQKREESMAVLESTASEFNKMLTTWTPEVDTPLNYVKLELTKLNSFFNHDMRSTSNPKSGILQMGSATTHTPSVSATDGPNWHRIEHRNRDCGFGMVFTQIHDPVKGMVYTSPPPPPSPRSAAFGKGPGSFHFAGSASQGSRM